ncbi:hypothetical protein HanRHA438_Chr02g0056011 [Helianthus annuus]|uniref:Uncharacterized protein n=1 Tax=Helianthus annuus TaxID=4232 RepID=A0A9K3JM34_HELAN|nr:hypothetical protein HanXRQr2_Chr02g0054471 [Helianthus annuus]KAJ0776489.1 putative beta-glucuronosyltransferase GlcAT14A/B/C [Helianthus annuus]KAJ0938991.1 hypothetical protein HanRHA438_Chr02g0056011 [Helianthus annuus]
MERVRFCGSNFEIYILATVLCNIYNLMLHVLCRFQRAKPVIVDPGLYMSEKSDVFWIIQRRSVPTAFKLFTGFCYGILFLYRELFRLYMLVIIGLPLNIVIWTYR